MPDGDEKLSDWASFRNDLATGIVGGVTSLHVRRAFGFNDRVDYGQIVADAFGNALGNALVSRMVKSSIEDQIEAAFDVMLKDKRFTTIMPTRKDWNASSLRVRLLCAILYQDVSGKDLLEKFRMLTISDQESA